MECPSIRPFVLSDSRGADAVATSGAKGDEKYWPKAVRALEWGPLRGPDIDLINAPVYHTILLFSLSLFLSLPLSSSAGQWKPAEREKPIHGSFYAPVV